jgi:DNA-binding beta-propeller fold protein YncE
VLRTPKKVPQPANNYTLFETLQVRPLAMTPDGKWLLACNTPDNKLEIYRSTNSGLVHVASVPVGLEPIAVQARTNTEAWVVNHLSDSVSIVSLDDFDFARVGKTLQVGDEPRDIVFAKGRAFISTAHRGQNSPDDPGLFDPSQGRADVWVFDATNPGDRLAKLTMFADTPRALAVSPDGSTVFAAPFFSGNMTTAVSVDAVRTIYADKMYPGNPNIILFYGTPQPVTGLVVKYRVGADGNYHWIDGWEGRVFDPFVKVSLPDLDVFAIDSSALAVKGAVPHVGTTLFNMAVNPATGKLYVSNTDAHNDVRFEGNRGADHLPFTSVRGNIVDSRISVVDPSTGATVHNNLNSHIVNGVGDATISRAFPQDLAFTADGSTLYAVAQGSGKLIWYASSALESGSAAPSASNQVTLAAGGPAGVALDEGHGRAYVLTRFDNGISSVDLRTHTETAHAKMYNPEPASVTVGRQYLYDATFTSGNGTQACASCHVGGDFDSLAWDLGNPAGGPLPITTAAGASIFTIDPAVIEGFLPAAALLFQANQPLKGPMTTQSLRGMDNHGSMHWRGDRNGAIQQSGAPFLDASGNPVVSAQPNAGIYNEALAFESFNVAFPGLVGRDAQLTADDMTAFRTFILQVSYPPNPIHNLDDSLTPIQAAGAQFFFNHAADGTELASDRFHNCNGCHVTDRNANAGSTDHPGFFGSSGLLSFELESQIFKVPHLRNLYQKIGMFASSPDSNLVGTVLPQLNPAFPDLNPAIPAVRGFGFQHDGVIGTLEHFFTAQVFIQIPVGQPATLEGVSVPPNPNGVPLFTFDPTTKQITGLDLSGFALRRAIVSYVLAFDSNMKPIVGQQTTLTGSNAAAVASRIALLESQAGAGNCDLVATAELLGRSAGFLYQNGAWVSDSTAIPPIPDATFRSLAGLFTDAITMTAVPPGSGWRIAVDRDADGFANLDEILAGTDPANPASHP